MNKNKKKQNLTAIMLVRKMNTGKIGKIKLLFKEG